MGSGSKFRRVHGSCKIRAHREHPTAQGIHFELFGSVFNYPDIKMKLCVSDLGAYCPLGVLSADTAKRQSQWKRTNVLSVEFKK